MAEDRDRDPADRPEGGDGREQDQPSTHGSAADQSPSDPASDERAAGKPAPDGPTAADRPEPYRLGGSGHSAAPHSAGGNPANPFESLFASLAGGDMNAVAAQLQSAFAMMGGSGGMFGAPTAPGSGVNWAVTKDTARKMAASLGPDPTPTSAQQRAIADAVSLAEVWLEEATSFPRVSATVAAWSRAEWIEATMPVWQRLVEPVATHIADAMEGALSLGQGEESANVPGFRRHGADAASHAAQLRSQHVRAAAGPGSGPTGD